MNSSRAKTQRPPREALRLTARPMSMFFARFVTLRDNMLAE
jgi:hypothetical protein